MSTVNKIIENNVEIEPSYAPKKGIVLARKVDSYLYISGHGPEDQVTGKPLYTGRIGAELSVEDGYAAARACAVIITGAVKDILGSLDRVERFIKVFGLVNCDNGFSDIDKVMDGFSDTIMQIFEERGYHTRTAMGTRNLPNGNIPVEIEAVIKIRE